MTASLAAAPPAVHPPLAEALAARLPTVSGVLDPHRAAELARNWAATARPDLRVDDVALQSALYGPGETLSVRYRILDTLGQRPRALTLLVRVPGPESPVGLAPFPHDPRLPSLPSLLAPDAAVRILRTSLPGVGRERGLAGCVPTVVHHPRAGACVLRYELRPGAAGFGELRHPRVFAKVYPRPDGAAHTAAVLRALGPVVAGYDGRDRVRLPRPLAVRRDVSAVFLDEVPGGPGATAETAGHVLAALHRHVPRAPLPAHQASHELARMDAELALVAAPWPEVADRVERLVAPARGLLSQTPGETAVTSHGDFTPSQVLTGEGIPGLVDLDGACSADPAFDLGRYLAYLGAAHARHGLPGPDVATLLAPYAEAGGTVDRTLSNRVVAYRSVSLARMALSAARQLKDARLHLALSLLSAREGEHA